MRKIKLKNLCSYCGKNRAEYSCELCGDRCCRGCDNFGQCPICDPEWGKIKNKEFEKEEETLTVKELIKKLEGFDDDREVRIYLTQKEHDIAIEEVTVLEGKDIVWIDVGGR